MQTPTGEDRTHEEHSNTVFQDEETMKHKEECVAEKPAPAGRPLPVLRWPICQNRLQRLGIDRKRAGTVCQGCRHDIEEGCPNTRVWSVNAETGVVTMCRAEDLVYCKHYDCGCGLCASFLFQNPVPLAARGCQATSAQCGRLPIPARNTNKGEMRDEKLPV